MCRAKSRLVIGGTVALGAVLAVACATTAMAQSTVYYGDSAYLTIPVTATIGVSCGFASAGVPSGTYSNIPIDTSDWQQDFEFTLECTGPSRIAVASANGGLENTTDPATPGYTNLAPYTVALHVVHDSGAADDTCPAADLESSSSAVCDLRGTASDSVGMSVPSPSYDLSGSYLRVSAPAYAGSDVLIDGTYSDTLTVTVSPAS